MITIITDITDEKVFKLYWMTLLCKYREIKFIFTDTKNLKYPKMRDWSNVKFAPKSKRDDVIKYAKSEVVYLTNQYEIPTYQLMTILREGKPNIGTLNGESFSVRKNNYKGKEPEITERYKTYKV